VTLDEPNKVATVIVPTDQMSLAIGKEGQNARLAYKLTGWRIDIKDPAALQEMDEDLLRQARAAMAESQADDFTWQGRQPRLVRADGTISVRDKTFGPLAPELIGMSVDVDLRGDALEVFYNRDLRHRFDFESGEALSLDEEPVGAQARGA
jgi:N utilization substance protein A